MRSRFEYWEYRHMTLYIPAEMKYRIEQIAAKKNMSTSALCRELFWNEIARHEICENSRPDNR